jgi:hypothetical protein
VIIGKSVSKKNFNDFYEIVVRIFKFKWDKIVFRIMFWFVLIRLVNQVFESTTPNNLEQICNLVQQPFVEDGRPGLALSSVSTLQTLASIAAKAGTAKLGPAKFPSALLCNGPKDSRHRIDLCGRGISKFLFQNLD